MSWLCRRRWLWRSSMYSVPAVASDCAAAKVSTVTLPLSKCWILHYMMWYDCHTRDHKHIKHYNFGIFEVFRHFSHTINNSVAVGEIQKYFKHSLHEFSSIIDFKYSASNCFTGITNNFHILQKIVILYKHDYLMN